MSKSVLAKITFVDQQGNPVDPDFGGGISGARPGHDLPGHEDSTDPGYGHPHLRRRDPGNRLRPARARLRRGRHSSPSRLPTWAQPILSGA